VIVRVAIDLALDKLFDYEVPEALKKKLAVGQLLSVPFGHREARGFAMDLAEVSSTKAKLKCISGIVDETPFFTPSLIELIKKVSDYTASPLEAVLKAAVPAAVLKKNAHAREQIFVEPVKDAKLPTLTKRQQWLYEQIVRLDGGWLASLCKELSTTPSSIKLLAEKGLVSVEPRARRRDPLASRRILPSRPLKLNAEQEKALSSITSQSREGAKPVLLYGVTGSGKTEVYLQAIAAELALSRGAIVLVPEISLTPQTVQRFASRFGKCVAVLHSALSDGERFDEWHRIRSGEARVVIGPRSAVWAPVKDLGLIVVDEEHEASYKQDETPRYNARDVAVMRGVIEKAKVVLGSATPSLESWRNASSGKYNLSPIANRAGAGTLPSVRLVNMEECHSSGGAIFSSELLEAIRLRLDRAEQTMLFLNKRGFSRQYSCAVCGYVVECPSCSLPYVYHRADKCLRCHVCGGWAPLPEKCPACSSAAFSCQGIGTQRAEDALKKCFPDAKVLRMDADSTSRRHSHDELLGAFGRGEADILIGTQMIAKGLDFPNVTLVGVLNADASLFMPDFRASERAFQLIAQVAGRAGRAELPGEVFVQTRDPSHPVLSAVVGGGYEEFALHELEERREAFFPPFSRLAVLNIKSKDLRLAGDWAQMYSKSLSKYASHLPSGSMLVSEAVPSVLEKADGWYRWQVVIRALSASSIVKAWKWLKGVRPAPQGLRAVIDIDAMNLV
jgi:primosomal protein N' (replication factor Y)